MLIVDPIRVFMCNGEVCTLKAAPKNLTTGTDKLIITAVTGKKLRLMGWQAQSEAAGLSSFQLKSGSGGTVIMQGVYVPSNANGVIDRLPVIESGYCETGTSVGLYADVATNNLNATFFYIEYTPT